MTLRVRLDDEGIRPVSKTYRAEESFDVAISNEGSPTHVNLAIEGEAERFVSVQVNNVYVAEGEEETVEVVVGPTPGEVEGTLKLSADYGSDSAEVELTLGDEDRDISPEGEGVEIDESLSQPMKPETEDKEIPRVDIVVGIVLGLAILLSLLYGILFGQLGVSMVIIAIAILGGAMVWTLKRTAEGPKPED
ncbi:MAG: hypothetical protein U5J64_04030 [Halobacteriales archaeon]|nr:hypothetical protein [Halobacteriales archaeon]